MSETLWRFDEAVRAAGGDAGGGAGPDLASVSIDSRTIEPNALFVAIRGERLDGHDFVGQAFKAGAGAAMVAMPTIAERMEVRNAASVIQAISVPSSAGSSSFRSRRAAGSSRSTRSHSLHVTCLCFWSSASQ